MYKSVLIVALTSALVPISSVMAEPYFTNCPGVQSTPNFNSTETHSQFFIESDFAAEMVAISPDTTDNGNVSEYQLRAVVKMAAEHWNQESRGAFLSYGGVISSDTSFYCPSSSEPTRIYVTFQQECQDQDNSTGVGNSNNSNCYTPSLAKIWAIPGCSTAVRITVTGNPTNDNPATASSVSIVPPLSSPRNWSLENQTPAGAFDLEATLTHEFGHALNLRDGAAPSMVNSVMTGARRFLYYYDKDCVDDNTGGRTVRPWYLGVSSGGIIRPKSQIDSTGPDSEKGALANGYWNETTKTGTKYTPYGSISGTAFNYWATLLTDGYFTYAEFSNDWSPNPVNATPTFFSLPEDTVYWDNQMVHYLWAASSTTTIDPPPIKAVASNNNFVSKTILTYKTCNNVACSSTSPLTSHVPMTSAYDPVSGRTIFVTVDTAGGLSGGEIRVHPGISGGLRDRLKAPATVSAEIEFTTINSGQYFEYDGTTQSAVGVACAPTAISGNNNCMLAWSDRGNPDFGVLYTYFNVNTSTDEVEFFSRAILRGGANTVAHVSAGYFAGNFWMGYREQDNYGRAYYMKNDLSSPYGWSGPTSVGATGYVADPPSFGYVPQGANEAAIYWTEVQ